MESRKTIESIPYELNVTSLNEMKDDFRGIDLKKQISPVIRRALEEDIGDGDLTTENILSREFVTSGTFTAKGRGIIAGIEVAKLTYEAIDENIRFVSLKNDGDPVSPGDVLARIRGSGWALMGGERVALNFIQRMSGIATLTGQFVTAVQDTSAIILDTRKTAPGLRTLDKWAVRLGGGQNHRLGLYDRCLIKENHILAAGSITEAVRRLRDRLSTVPFIEVEVQNLRELEEAANLEVDRILIDNASIEILQKAVQFLDGKIPLEASGNMSLDNVSEVARTGVDYISVGSLTHSTRALDVSFVLDENGATRKN